MKKFLALLLALSLSLSLFACGSDQPAKEDTEKEVATAPEKPEAEPIQNLLTPEETAKKYYEAMAVLDYDTIFDMCIDPYAVKMVIENGEFADEAAFRAAVKEEFKEEYEEDILSLGDNRKVTRFDVIETIDVPDEELEGEWQYIFSQGDVSYPAGAFDGQMVVTAAITIAGDNEEISVESGNTPLFKVDGKWYVGSFLMSIQGAKVEHPAQYQVD